MTERSLNINGNVILENKCGLSIHNRAFRYGDGLFESIRASNGKPLFLEDHFSRLSRGMKALEMDIPPFWDQAFFKKEVQKLIPVNNITRGGRIRCTVFRKGEGNYVPKSSEFGFVIEAYEGESNEFILNETGLNLGIYKDMSVPLNKLSSFKTNNCLIYVMAGLDARKRNFDDVILLNENGNLCEGISSNLFVYTGGIVYTPSLKEACIAGVMRKKIIQLLKKRNIAVIESSLSKEVLQDADEVFLTNSIAGPRWVKAFDKKRYFHKLSESLVRDLNALI